MASLIAIRRRIRSVKNTQQITKAMKMVAAAKLRRSQDRVIASRPYAKALRAVLSSVSTRVGEASHPLLAERPEKNVVVLAVSGDRGLAGAFNTSVNRAVTGLLREKGWESAILMPVGRKSLDFWRRRKARMTEKTYPGIFAKVEYAQAQEIAAFLSGAFVEGKLDAAYVVYNEFRSVISQVVRIAKILPISRAETKVAEAGAAGAREYIFEPGPAQILERILPRYVEFAIFQTLLESAAAENAARMTAMDAASKNAADVIESLTLTYNRARQARITKELIEIVSGAAALD
ncbi:MAG TPA: ATP synthase F1 subunit gamma [Thermoanaerobaculia bacterium]